MLELDQILLAVNDLDVASGSELANVAGAEIADAIEEDEVGPILFGYLKVRVGWVRVVTLRVRMGPSINLLGSFHVQQSHTHPCRL